LKSNPQELDWSLLMPGQKLMIRPERRAWHWGEKRW